MIYIMLLWVVISTVAISVCYSDAKKYHYTMKFFLEECLYAVFLFPITSLFLLDRLMEFFKIKFPEFKINTDFITKFLNKRL
jgi:hypothetical protein